ncbi:MAG: hypothetical protein HGA85_07180 [Nanoarchaeota archaeon]|nr:hypothetical protein [Nanoarchaeota archaeon]
MFAASAYREWLGQRILGGGKSGYPDRLYIPSSEKGYVEVISIPGHFTIGQIAENQSMPPLRNPNRIVYLIDPDIDEFYSQHSYTNHALNALDIHLSEYERLKGGEVPITLLISKRTPMQKQATEAQIESAYYGYPRIIELSSGAGYINSYGPESRFLDAVCSAVPELSPAISYSCRKD